jgi:hypothetical protein
MDGGGSAFGLMVFRFKRFGLGWIEVGGIVLGLSLVVVWVGGFEKGVIP